MSAMSLFEGCVATTATTTTTSLKNDIDISPLSDIAYSMDIIVICCTLLVGVVTVSVCRLSQTAPPKKLTSGTHGDFDIFHFDGAFVPMEKFNSLSEKLSAAEKENKRLLKRLSEVEAKLDQNPQLATIYFAPEGCCYHASHKCRALAHVKAHERRACKICVE